MILEEIMSGELQYLEFKRDFPEKSENKSIFWACLKIKRDELRFFDFAPRVLILKDFLKTEYQVEISDILQLQTRLLVRYIKEKEIILEYLQRNTFVTNEKNQQLCGFTRQQVRGTVERMGCGVLG